MNEASPSPHTYTFKIEPDDHGGRTKTVALTRQNILPAAAKRPGRDKKFSHTAHILLGFDTEYQSDQAAEEKPSVEPGSRNLLLSYQFAARVVTKDGVETEPKEAEGIIIPEGTERLSMEEFIGIAIGSLVDKHPGIVLPTDIYLVGHFTRADLPAFSDFRSKAKEMMSNVRSTFTSIDRFIPVVFADGQGTFAEFHVRVRDTMLLAPAGAKSLAEIGKIVGFNKIELHSDPVEELKIKENMAQFRAENWPMFREYAIRDAQVCVHFAERIMRQHVALFDEFKMPATLTGFGTKLVLADWKAAGLDADQVLGRETIEDRSFSKKKGYFSKKVKRPLVEDAHYEQAFVVETYHGGRNEQFIFGPAAEGAWNDHDLSSAYATAMSLIGLAKWEEIQRIDNFQGIDPLDLAFFSVDFEFPKTVRFPTLPVRTANGIIFPRKGNSKCCSPELDLAIRLGAEIRFRRGLLVPADRTRPIFLSFLTACIQERTKRKDIPFDNLFWKEVGNSTYGKTAQGLREKRVYDLRDDDMIPLPESEITQPYFASFITSFTRAVLGEILNGFSSKVSVFSVTTDGFLSNADQEEIDRATSGPLFHTFKQARNQLDQSDTALEIKHNVRQPIGWRTRGSATLKKGVGEKCIVLQKGGLKTNQHFNTDQENSYTVEEFLKRSPDSAIPYKSGIGLRYMMQQDTDFVYRSVTKRLSMEFDWKREPVDPRDVTFDFEGRTCSHLGFDTAPIEGVAEFNAVRDAWEKYNKNPHRNLKTLNDFNNFHLYQTTNVDLHKEPLKYLKKVDGDLKRLRRDLTRAFKKFQAGFDIERQSRRVTNAQFADVLTACGIPCLVTDVENGKKAEFKPHQTVVTDRVLAALRKLKADFYPALEIDLFMVEGTTQKSSKSDFAVAA